MRAQVWATRLFISPFHSVTPGTLPQFPCPSGKVITTCFPWPLWGLINNWSLSRVCTFFFLCCRFKYTAPIVQCLRREVTTSERKSPQCLQAQGHWSGLQAKKGLGRPRQKNLTCRQEKSSMKKARKGMSAAWQLPHSQAPCQNRNLSGTWRWMLFTLWNLSKGYCKISSLKGWVYAKCTIEWDIKCGREKRKVKGNFPTMGR